MSNEQDQEIVRLSELYDGQVAEIERLRAALEEVRRYTLAVVGASEAYGETESAHLWQEVADIADGALYPPVESQP